MMLNGKQTSIFVKAVIICGLVGFYGYVLYVGTTWIGG